MTRKFLFTLLYAAFTLGANPVLADAVDFSEISALRAGDMKKLAFHSGQKPKVQIGFVDKDGNETSLDAYKGKLVLLNFWATWCPPCLAEMPSLDALQADLGGDDFAVVTVATGRNPLPAIQKFFKKAEIKNLPILRDPKRKFSQASGVFGLPTTLVINPEGHEIARVLGDVDWHSDEAVTLFKALIQTTTAEAES